MKKQLNIRKYIFFIFIGLLAVILSTNLWAETIKRQRRLHRPRQVTSETSPILSMGISNDGKWLVCATARDGFSDLWLYSADPKKIILPRRITNDPSVESSPVFSADGKYLAFTGTGYDVKGDIYLLEMDKGNSTPTRLTQRDTNDGGPSFGPIGNILYFHQILSGSTVGRLVSLNLDTRKLSILETGGDGMFPSISPDGSKICFVSYRKHTSGDIYIFDQNKKTVYSLTHGPAIDFSPSWTEDGRYIVFSRIAFDTDKDGVLTTKDTAGIYKLDIQNKKSAPYPLTLYDDSAFNPIVRNQKLFFISQIGGINNCWQLPIDGVISRLTTKENQIALAQEMGMNIPYNPFVTLLAYFKVLEVYHHDKSVALAAYEIGNIFESLDMPDAAEQAYEELIKEFPDIDPYYHLSQIKQLMIQTKNQLKNLDQVNAYGNIIHLTLQQLNKIEQTSDSNVRARSLIESARLLMMTRQDAKALLDAVHFLDQVKQETPELRSENAEALVLKADIYAMIGQTKDIYNIYMTMIKTYSDQTKWADYAVNKIIEHRLMDSGKSDFNDKIRYLRKIAEDNKESAPLLSMGALNRIGDLYYAEEKLTQAKTAYAEVIREFPVLTTQTAAARFSLAEILYREERFKMALDLYEAELDLRPYRDRIHRLARRGYIRKSVAAGEFLFRLGEVSSAQSKFKEIMDYDDTIVEAHRGYIKCAAALGKTENVLNIYENRLKQEPDNPVLIYCKALCLTYFNNKESLIKAQVLLEEAINLNGQIEFFHQTQGYVLEALETVYSESGNLEKALESYKKAYFLNDPEVNPENRANLMLNMGNIYFALKQYNQAFKYYSQREASDIDFDHNDTRIIFLTRLGIAAFHSLNNGKAEDAFVKALDLIDRTINPKKTADAFDKTHRFIMDRVIIPALEDPNLAKSAKKISISQTSIHQKLSLATETVQPPPSKAWKEFKNEINKLISEEEKVVPKAVSMAGKATKTNVTQAQVSQNLTFLMAQIQKALRDPERLIQLKIQTMERLGLVYQEEQKWEQALKIFQDVFDLNQQLGFTENLAKNKRVVAYNQYMFAHDVQGGKRHQLLQDAAENFRQTITLIDNYGVLQRDQGKTSGLINISVETSLDNAGGTQAARGFTKDQEKRLCEAFISRICIELDEIHIAETAIKSQLAQYPPDAAIQEKDMYGVSLLYHRAGLIYASQNVYQDAFTYFEYSSDFTEKLGNAVSTALNVTNMGHVFLKLINDVGDITPYLSTMTSHDKTASRLLADPRFPDSRMEAWYHNQMGAFYAACQTHDTSQTPLDTIQQIRAYQQAMAHFRKGVDVLEKERTPNREIYALKASLNLNMAALCTNLGEPDHAESYFQSALEAADKGLLPDLKWRAQKGLGLFDEAFETLHEVTFFRAFCGTFEIMDSFSEPVLNLIQQGEIEAAFNMVENLSELERFHRTAFVLQNIEKPEIEIYRKVYPRLLRINVLRESLMSAEDKDKEYYNNMLSDEQMLVQKILGTSGENLSDVIQSISSEEMQKQVMILIGLAADAEAYAEEIARTRDPEKNIQLMETYNNIKDRFFKQRQHLVDSRSQEASVDIVTFFGPEPYEDMDVMDFLPEGVVLFRLYENPNTNEIFAFTVTKEDINVQRFQSIDDALKNIRQPLNTYVAFEAPEKIDPKYACVLSGTHFVRSLLNRKPFKRALFAVPRLDGVPTIYDAVNFQDTKDTLKKVDASILANSHILFLDGEVRKSITVPTRPGEAPKTFLSLTTQGGDRIRIEKLLTRTENLSLAVLAAPMEDVYITGHLFSIFGCPTICYTPPQDPIFLKGFFNKYPNKTSFDVLQALEVNPDHRSRLLGYKGMTPVEAEAFSKTHFVAYVKEGRAAFDNGNHIQALSLFENAVNIVLETHIYENLLSALYQYARESAFIINDYKKSARYAKDLAALLETQNPDTEAHAQALLQYGIILSRQEKYDKAVPIIEESVEILENLELDEKTVLAMSNLGIVLENATEYDRALDFFKSAVDISQSFDQGILLAGQYENMGRIYDLRLSQYMLAIRNYQMAYDLYKNSRHVPKMAQTLLNMGRCYRLLGNFNKADALYKEAQTLMDNLPEEANLKAKLIMEMANNAWFQARYEEAFRLQRQALELAREHDLFLVRIISLNTSGLIWWTLGNNDKALIDLEKALSYANDLPDRQDEVATTLNNIGLIYRDTGRYMEALKAFDKALEIDTVLKSRWAMAYDYRNKALTLLKIDRAEEAIPLFIKARDESNAIGNRINEAKALLGLGEAYLAINKPEAEKVFNDALDLSTSMSIRETQWRSIFGLAKLKLSNEPDTAENLLKEAVSVIEDMRADIKIEKLKESFVDNKASVYETLVSLLIQKGKITEAFEIAERSRARNFIDLLGNQRISFGNSVDQKYYEQQITIRQRMDETKALLAQSTDPAEQEIHRTTLKDLTNQYNDLMLDIQAQNPEMASMISVSPLKANELIDKLDQDVALLAFYVLPKEILCWKITNRSDAGADGNVKLYRTPLGRDSFGQAILNYRRMIQNLEPLETQSQALYTWLLSQIVPDLDGITKLGIIPHGPLHYLSFATLFDGNKYLIDDFSLFYLPSASVWNYTRDRRVDKKNLKVLAIGNPDLGDPLLNLPFAEHEVGAIKWNFPDITVLTGDKATEEWVAEHIEEFGIIHMASHGEFDVINPLFSAIKLSKDAKKDGNLEAAEVFGLKIRADLVVLSACQTGLGKVTKGDDVIGLNRAFFYAGTHTIVSSLWRVSDVSTAILIKEFYRQYQNHTKADSLRNAILHVKNRYPHPGYWGAFTLVGDYY